MVGLSLGSWAFVFGPHAAHPAPLNAVVKRLYEAEYDGIELCGFEPHVTLERYATPESRRKLTALLEDHGLGVSGYMADFSAINPVIEGNKFSYLDRFHHAVDLCLELNSPSIRVDSVAVPGSVADRDYQAAFDRLADTWMDAAEIAARSKVRLVWEFEPGRLFNKPSEVLAMHRAVAHPNFRILFDTAHAYMCGVAGARQHGPKETLPGGLPEFVKKLEGCLGAIHVMDCDGTLYHRESSTHRPFGEGYIDFNVLAPQLLDLASIDWWCIDMCCWPDSWDLIESSRDFVLDLLDSKVAA